MSALQPAPTFTYEFRGRASWILTGGDVEWDDERNLWKATMVVQSNPEIKVEAWHEDSAAAGLICCAKWMGYDKADIGQRKEEQ